MATVLASATNKPELAGRRSPNLAGDASDLPINPGEKEAAGVLAQAAVSRSPGRRKGRSAVIPGAAFGGWPCLVGLCWTAIGHRTPVDCFRGLGWPGFWAGPGTLRGRPRLWATCGCWVWVALRIGSGGFVGMGCAALRVTAVSSAGCVCVAVHSR